jgi:hypothetical protein
MPNLTDTSPDTEHDRTLNPGQKDYEQRFNPLANAENKGTVSGDNKKDASSGGLDFVKNNECALAHSRACGGRLRHLPYTPQCASSRSVF